MYKLAGAVTYRASSVKVLGRWGGNRQNIEKSQRQRYVADEGKVFVQCDQSGADALIVAHSMPATNKLRQLFDNGIKVHKYLGLVFTNQWEKDWPIVHELSKLPIPELAKHPQSKAFFDAVAASDENPPATRYYYHYKQTGHSANYGIEVNTFIENILLKSKGKVKLTKAQGQKLLDGYHSLIPEIKGWYHIWVARQYEKTGVLRNFQGFPITLTQKLDTHQYTKIYDKIPQSTVGCITHIAATNFCNYTREHKLKEWDFIANTHDSYLLHCPKNDMMDCAKVARELMEQELVSPFGEKFRMRSETQWGLNWAPWKKNVNEDGLVSVKF